MDIGQFIKTNEISYRTYIHGLFVQLDNILKFELFKNRMDIDNNIIM